MTRGTHAIKAALLIAALIVSGSAEARCRHRHHVPGDYLHGERLPHWRVVPIEEVFGPNWQWHAFWGTPFEVRRQR